MQDLLGLIYSTGDAEILEWIRKSEMNQLRAELFLAEMAARKGGKRKTYDTHKFEVNLLDNLEGLAERLWNYTYKPSRGTAHIIFKPVQREIFAAPYVDRVVHHYIVGAINSWWDKRLSPDSYSCRVGKGTSYGIKRMDHHIRSVSQNFKIPTYVVKMDITGYFMHIRRDLLLELVLGGLDKQFDGQKNTKRYKMLKHAITAVIMDDPVKGVRIQGSYSDWRELPEDKSLFAQPKGRGMVIGNLTSQHFSNIYLDGLDRFITFELGYKHYGRYVDDFYIVVTKEQLPQVKRDIVAIGNYLNGIGASLNTQKTKIIPQWHGVPFLGMVLRNGAILPGDRVTRNFIKSLNDVVAGEKDINSVISYMGMLIHYDSERRVREIFQKAGQDYR